MKIIKNNEAKKFDANGYVSYEYNSNDSAINIARIEIRGRIPETGSMRNTKVKEICYVESGEGSITIEGAKHELSSGDVVYYEPNKRVFWEGNLVLIIACTPAWTLKQHEMLPE